MPFYPEDVSHTREFLLYCLSVADSMKIKNRRILKILQD